MRLASAAAEQLVDVVSLVIGDAVEDLGELGLWADTVELGRPNQGVGVSVRRRPQGFRSAFERWTDSGRQRFQGGKQAYAARSSCCSGPQFQGNS